MIATPKNRTDNINKISFLVAISCVLQIAESLIPHPIPGLRLGLANIIVLISLVEFGFAVTLEIVILRTILSSFIMGTFMGPSFILSFFSGIISTLVMIGFFLFNRLNIRFKFSIISVSILGALAHNIVQLTLAYMILIKHKGIFIFLPWMCIGSVFMGFITATIAVKVLRKIRTKKEAADYCFQDVNSKKQVFKSQHIEGDSWLHLLPAKLKIQAMIIFAVSLFLFKHHYFYLTVFSFIIAFVLSSAIPLKVFLKHVKRYIFFILVSFLIPFCFSKGDVALFKIGFFNITSIALKTGLLYSLRMFLLILSSSLIVLTTSCLDLTSGFSKTFSFLRFFGFSEDRLAKTMSLAWARFPVLWDETTKKIKNSFLNKEKNLKSLLENLSQIVAESFV